MSKFLSVLSLLVLFSGDGNEFGQEKKDSEVGAGILVLGEYLTDKDTVRVYDASSLLWLSFPIYDYENIAYNESERFAPYAITKDYNSIAFICKEVTDDWFLVYVDKLATELKYIKSTDEVFDFFTWKNFIPSRRYKTIGIKGQSVYASNSTSSNDISAKLRSLGEGEYRVQGKRVVGDWAKLYWNRIDEGGGETEVFCGWVMWQNEHGLALSFEFH